MSTAQNLYARAQENLEFPEIIQQLVNFSKSEEGRKLCRNLQPCHDLTKVEELQSETADTLKVIRQRDSIPMGNFPDLSEPFAKVRIHSAVLSIEELFDIKIFLETLDELKSFRPDEDSEFYLENNKFYELLDHLQSLEKLYKELKRCIITDDSIADNASINLRNIRRNIIKAQNAIKSHLEKIVSSSEASLQEQLITLRRGRYVVPVKAEYKKKVAGIVHDTSQSGQTLFIEPLAVVEENNYLRELAAEEEREIWRILQGLSELVRNHLDGLKLNLEIMAKLDFWQAKARLALAMDASRPLINDKGHINLKQARHPHIAKNKVVPIDLSLGKDYNTLLITGPNTGGKTVSLKTCGLLTIMAMCGLQIPATEKSEVSIFEQIFTDIGDEQSIAEDLSTFSAHMQTLVNIIENLNSKTLVLVDELGSGTDPAEGAALAIAVLDYIKEFSCVTLVTTHFKELKLYALETSGVENASMEFDEASLKPTFKVLVGIPGTSHAFSIAERMGLEEDIVLNARRKLSDAEINLEKILAEIESNRKELEEAKERLIKLEASLNEQLELAKYERQRYEIARQDLANDTRHEKRTQLIRQSQAIDSLIDEFDKKLNSGEADIEDMKTLRSLLRGELKEVENEIGTATLKEFTKAGSSDVDLGIGDEAYAASLGLDGKIITEPDNKGQVQFRAGQITVTLALDSLEPARSKRAKRKAKEKDKVNDINRRKSVKSKVMSSFSTELILIGEMVEPALHILDDYLDDAVLANVDRVRIVHGKGTGALKNAVQDFLRKDRRVVKFELAEFGEGDAGVTIAYIK